MKVLIVEDDSLLLNLYSIRLTHEGLSVELASDGTEALRILQKSTPDVIVLDLVMPRMDGFAFLTTLWQQHPKPIPVIVVTNLDSTEDRQKAEELHVVDYILKSKTNLDIIVQRIRQYDPKLKA